MFLFKIKQIIGRGGDLPGHNGGLRRKNAKNIDCSASTVRRITLRDLL